MSSPRYIPILFLLLSMHLAGNAQATPAGLAKDVWVATWATAQDLAPTTPDQPILAPGVKRPDFSGRARRNPPYIPQSIVDKTVRMVVHTSIGGGHVRIELSNAFGKDPVTIGEASVAPRQAASSVVAGSMRSLTFGGSKGVKILPGALVVSDPVDIDLKPESDLAVSLYIEKADGVPTNHTLGLHTAYFADGNVAAQAALDSTTPATSYFWLRSVDVAARRGDFSIVCLGDSITDGAATSLDKDKAWPTLLAARLREAKRGPAIAVLNEGISGNEVLHDGAGVSALARFDRDVLSLPGVMWVILLEGINDINIHGEVTDPSALTAQHVIRGYRQILARAHLHGVRVMGATLTPDEGIWLYGPVGEATRQAVNQWIRTSGEFDATVDFDAAVRDKSHPTHLLPEFDSGDHIHPNDAGNQAMADAIPLHDFVPKAQ